MLPQKKKDHRHHIDRQIEEKSRMDLKSSSITISLSLILSHLITTAAAINDTSSNRQAHQPSSASVDLYSMSPCRRGGSSIAECSQDLDLDLESEEMSMESETSRRFMEEEKRRYISPGALKRDQPVCNGGGAGEPYSRGSGCLPQPSRPYNRGCQKYYRCRSDA
ncbi:protein RALF-like 32 [Andrographis paniculata]|uniref:protein RALF-like 32 n=1 Tax=Andrographis paniculata TaxID=175694 RepID=UPI0021E7D077|nr:protein RALF-like 32 [Andrographis paniculata]